MEAHKACSKCGLVKPLSAFGRSKKSKDGHTARCLECQRQYNRESWHSGRTAAHHRKNPVTYQLAKMVNSSRSRAKEKNLPHTVNVKYLRTIFATHCPYLGVELRWETSIGLGRKQRTFDNSPSLDRIDSTKGYVPGNVVIVSHRANAIKSDATEQELFKLARNVTNYKMHLICQDMQKCIRENLG